MPSALAAYPRKRIAAPWAALLAVCLVATGCTGGGGGTADAGETSGPPYAEPSSIATSSFDAAAATGGNGGLIDTSHAALGYVGASAQNGSRLKFQVIKDGMSYNYDLPGDGTPIICPLNMGDGTYEFRIMQNTSGTNYVQLTGTTANVALESPFEPYLRPNLFCSYTESSACVAQARQLAAGAENQGDVVRAVYDWMVRSIAYDSAKAAQLADTTGYVPDPDATMSAGSGICFDYASLAAAIFRSLGIPCQIVTGYVSPDNIYHAWNMIYIDGTWVSAQITVEANQWTRIDLTFAAGGADASYIGDGSAYTDRYVY